MTQKVMLGVLSCYPKMDGMEIHPKAHHGEEIPFLFPIHFPPSSDHPEVPTVSPVSTTWRWPGMMALWLHKVG